MTPHDKLTQHALKAAPEIARRLFETGIGNCYITDKTGVRHRIRIFRGHIKAVDLGGFRFIGQNPNKNSKWAKLAREGHKILWVIRLSDNVWAGRVVDGQTTQL